MQSKYCTLLLRSIPYWEFWTLSLDVVAIDRVRCGAWSAQCLSQYIYPFEDLHVTVVRWTRRVLATFPRSWLVSNFHHGQRPRIFIWATSSSTYTPSRGIINQSHCCRRSIATDSSSKHITYSFIAVDHSPTCVSSERTHRELTWCRSY